MSIENLNALKKSLIAGGADEQFAEDTVRAVEHPVEDPATSAERTANNLRIMEPDAMQAMFAAMEARHNAQLAMLAEELRKANEASARQIAELQERAERKIVVAPPAKDRPKAWIPVAGEVSCYVKGDKVDYTAVVRCERRFTDSIGGRVMWGNSGQPVADYTFNAAHVRDILAQPELFAKLADDAEKAYDNAEKRGGALSQAQKRIKDAQAKAGLRKSGAAKLI